MPVRLLCHSSDAACVCAATVYGFLEVLRIPPGEYLLQSAAGSVLGRQLIALAKHRGIRTIDLVRRPEQKQELLDLGWVSTVKTFQTL